MRRRQVIKLLGGAAAACPLAARAQQGGREYVIGRFSAGSAAEPTNDDFTEALRELGWVEGENVVFERRYAENQLERLPELAADLVPTQGRSQANDGHGRAPRARGLDTFRRNSNGLAMIARESRAFRLTIALWPKGNAYG